MLFCPQLTFIVDYGIILYMERLLPYPNTSNKLRQATAVLIVGAIGITGCAYNQSNHAQDRTTEDTKTLPTDVLNPNNDCVVTGNGGAIMSNTPKTVRTFVEEYVADLDNNTPEDLSQCVDETLNTVVHDPINVNIGAGSPESKVNTVFVPTAIEPR